MSLLLHIQWFIYHVCHTEDHKYEEIPLCPLHKLLNKWNMKAINSEEAKSYIFHIVNSKWFRNILWENEKSIFISSFILFLEEKAKFVPENYSKICSFNIGIHIARNKILGKACLKILHHSNPKEDIRTYKKC